MYPPGAAGGAVGDGEPAGDEEAGPAPGRRPQDGAGARQPLRGALRRRGWPGGITTPFLLF